MRLRLISVLGVCVPGQPHVEEHHEKHNDTREVLPVDEERCEREGSEEKVDKVVRQELRLLFDVLLFAVGDHVVESDVPQHIQQAAEHTKYQDPEFPI